MPNVAHPLLQPQLTKNNKKLSSLNPVWSLFGTQYFKFYISIILYFDNISTVKPRYNEQVRRPSDPLFYTISNNSLYQGLSVLIILWFQFQRWWRLHSKNYDQGSLTLQWLCEVDSTSHFQIILRNWRWILSLW